MMFSIKQNLELLHRSYKQLAVLWFVYAVMVTACTLLIQNVARGFLDRAAENVLAEMQSKVASDMLEAETALRSASLNLERMILAGSDARGIQGYIREFNDYVLRDNRRVTGVMGVYGVFYVYGGVFIDGYGRTEAANHSHSTSPWYGAAVDAKGGIAITPPYFDEELGEWMITFSRCLFGEEGKPLAVTGLDMYLGPLRKYFTDTHLAAGGYGILVDQDLNVIAASAQVTIGKHLSVLQSPDIHNIIALLNSGENLKRYRTVNNREGGEPVNVYSRKIENGWHIGILTPTKKYFKEVYDRGVSIIILGIVLQLILTLIVLRIAVARQKLEEKSRQKSNFLANMSHEIRTPMNAIIGFAELALREDVPPAAYEHIFTIKQAGANLLSIVNDILDLSKIESGKLEIVKGDYLFSSLVNDVVSIIKMRATYSRLRFVVNVDSNIPNALYGDEIRVRQSMLNLLSNAVKYTEKGYVALTITGAVNDDYTVTLNIEVADSGRGIKKEDVKRLFKDFVQVDKAKNKGIEGTGLGLAITNNIMLAMGGSISVESEYGKGSVFTLTLPQRFVNPDKHAYVEDQVRKNVLIYERRELYASSITRTLENLGVNCTLVASESEFDALAGDKQHHFIFTAPALCERAKKVLAKCGSNAKLVLLTEFGDAVSDHQSVTILPVPAYSVTVANVLNGVSDTFSSGAKKQSFARFIAPEAHVLVVDDTNTNLRVAEGLLAPYKMRVTLCKSGPEAIEAVQSERFDIVFMDHMMPGMDGLEATRRIRGLGGERYRKLPVVALTANAVAGAREMFLSEGCDDFISKPIEITKLNAVLDRWIPQKKRKPPTEENDKPGADEDACGVNFKNVIMDGVDVAKGIALSGGSGTNYLRTLTMFYEDGFEKIEEIKRCLDMEDLQLYATHIHGLKSASASIGATAVSELAMALETAGKEGNLTYISTHTPKFLMDLEALLREIGRVQNELKAGKNSNVNIDTLTRELAKLKKALDVFDSEVIDQATNALQEYEDAANFGGVVKMILQDVLIGEYENAMEVIKELLDRLGGSDVTVE